MTSVRRSYWVLLAVFLGSSGCSDGEGALLALNAQIPDAGAWLPDASAPETGFVSASGTELSLDGKPFRFAGANNYSFPYESQQRAGLLLQAAHDARFNVLRTAGFFEIGTRDGSDSIAPKAGGVVYTQYWAPELGRPAFNDGADGLERLDYAVYHASELGLKLVLPLVDNWHNFGGMDQYVRWAGAQYHDDFYTSPQIKGWYRAWVEHLLTRTNPFTGLAYRDDPTILIWELANEPRCRGDSEVYPRSSACGKETLTAWANEMSGFLRELGARQLIAVGDEGFFCDAVGTDWTERCTEGVDSLALGALEHVDLLSFHLYPEAYHEDEAFGPSWIARHAETAASLRKPCYLGEFGLQARNLRNPTFKAWTDALLESGAAGALVWRLLGTDASGTPDPDYDGFGVDCPSPVCTALGNFADRMGGAGDDFAPVADDDSVETPIDTPVTLNPSLNDIGYGTTHIDPARTDLDAAAPGQQTELTLAEGSFALSNGGEVRFQPALGFQGWVELSTLAYDDSGRASAPARLGVSVVDPNRLILHSFERGTEGFIVPSWSSASGTLEHSADFATDGSYSLKILPRSAGWFGVVYSEPLDLTGKSKLYWDIRTRESELKSEIALQSGASWSWCDGGTWTVVAAQTDRATLSADLTHLTCAKDGVFDPSLVRGLYLYAGEGGTGAAYFDAIRAE